MRQFLILILLWTDQILGQSARSPQVRLARPCRQSSLAQSGEQTKACVAAAQSLPPPSRQHSFTTQRARAIIHQSKHPPKCVIFIHILQKVCGIPTWLTTSLSIGSVDFMKDAVAAWIRRWSADTHLDLMTKLLRFRPWETFRILSPMIQKWPPWSTRFPRCLLGNCP